MRFVKLAEINYDDVRMISFHELSIHVLLQDDVHHHFHFDKEEQLAAELARWAMPPTSTEIGPPPPFDDRRRWLN